MPKTKKPFDFEKANPNPNFHEWAIIYNHLVEIDPFNVLISALQGKIIKFQAYKIFTIEKKFGNNYNYVVIRDEKNLDKPKIINDTYVCLRFVDNFPILDSNYKEIGTIKDNPELLKYNSFSVAVAKAKKLNRLRWAIIVFNKDISQKGVIDEKEQTSV